MNTVTFGRLTLVEWRKQLDTRASRWLVISIALITAAVLAIMAWVDGPRSLESFYFGTFTPMSLLLPVVGILAATSEWSQRTGLITFTLEPRRTRVGLAKLTSSVLLGTAFFAVAIGLAALAHLAAIGFADVTPAWEVPPATIWAGLLLTVLWMAQGIAFGTLILNTAGAIVAFFAVPTAFSLVGSLIGSVRDILPWIDFSTASTPLLFDPAGMTGEQWGQFAVAAGIWVLLPLALGLIRVARAEIKSA